MRIHHLVLIALVSVLGCNNSKKCEPACDEDNERCVDGECQPCGDPGETCCMKASFFQCNDGIACDNTHEPICSGSCGTVGLPCCDGVCPDATCDESGMCIDACNGDSPHFFWNVDVYGCAWAQHDFSSGPSAEDAQSCAAATLAQLDPDKKYHLGPIDGTPQCKDVCSDVNDPFGSYKLCAFSDQELASCELSQCQNCNWVDGKCPGAPP
jgi:hypothetical protein